VTASRLSGLLLSGRSGGRGTFRGSLPGRGPFAGLLSDERGTLQVPQREVGPGELELRINLPAGARLQ
jgi:hypothetical protein